MFIQYQSEIPPLPQPVAPTFSAGSLIAMTIGLLLSQVLFGFWGKSKADDHNVHPLIGFALGFTLGWVGVAIVPLFKSNNWFVKKNNPAFSGPPTGTNPIYGHGTAFQPPSAPLEQEPMQAQEFVPVQQQPQVPPPPTPLSPQPFPQVPVPGQSAPIPPSNAPTILVADEQGYVECPACQAKSKSNRSSCMSCGAGFPEIFEPNF